MCEQPGQGAYDAIVMAVGHREFRDLGAPGLRSFGKAGASVVYDLKGLLPKADSDLRL